MSGAPPLHKSPLSGPSPSPKRQRLDSSNSQDLDISSSAAAAAAAAAGDGDDDGNDSSSLAARVAAFVNGDGRRPRSDTLCSHKSEYDEKAAMYDSYRGASPGWAIMSPLLTGGAGTAGGTVAENHGDGENHGGLAGKRVLDLGCGTGGFFGKLLSKGPASLTAYDVSESMIEKAKAKAAAFGAPGGEYAHIPIDVRCATTADLAAGSFDAIVCLQVLQNICPDPAEGRGEAARRSFLLEMRRLLVPGGSVMITTRYRKQPHDVAAAEEEEEEEAAAEEGDEEGGAAAAGSSSSSSSSSSTYGDLYWYADRAVLPRAVAFMEGAVPARPAQELEHAGFEGCALHNSTDTMIRSDAYFNGEFLAGVSGEKEAKAFQAADSFFSRLDGAEQAALRAHVAGLREKGELEAYVARRDKKRGKLGQVAVVVGRKPLL